jgi:hypothetical protein
MQRMQIHVVNKQLQLKKRQFQLEQACQGWEKTLLPWKTTTRSSPITGKRTSMTPILPNNCEMHQQCRLFHKQLAVISKQLNMHALHATTSAQQAIHATDTTASPVIQAVHVGQQTT